MDKKAVVKMDGYKKSLSCKMVRLEVVELIVAVEQCLDLIKISENVKNKIEFITIYYYYYYYYLINLIKNP